METSRALFELYEGAVVCTALASRGPDLTDKVVHVYSLYIKE